MIELHSYKIWFFFYCVRVDQLLKWILFQFQIIRSYKNNVQNRWMKMRKSIRFSVPFVLNIFEKKKKKIICIDCYKWCGSFFSNKSLMAFGNRTLSLNKMVINRCCNFTIRLLNKSYNERYKKCWMHCLRQLRHNRLGLEVNILVRSKPTNICRIIEMLNQM